MSHYFQLRPMMLDYFRRVGHEEAAKYLNVRRAQIAHWSSRETSEIPIMAVQKVMDLYYQSEQAKILGESASLGKIFMVHRPSWERQHRHGYLNRAATEFYKNENYDWFFHVGSDVVFGENTLNVVNGVYGGQIPIPFGADDTAKRLSGHEEKSLVSALSFAPDEAGAANFYEAKEDGGHNTINRVAHFETPCERLEAVKAFGPDCFIAHRSVFEAIVKEIPEVKPTGGDEPYGFFTPTYRLYDDVGAFCIRAKVSGHQPYVDFGCLAGTVGEQVFWNHNTKASLNQPIPKGKQIT